MRLRLTQMKRIFVVSFVLYSTIQIFALDKIIIFQPLASDEYLSGKTVVGKTERAYLYKTSIDGKEQLVCELGIMADFSFNMFYHNKKCLVLIDDSNKNNGVDDLWLIDGVHGFAKPIVKTTVIYNTSTDGNVLCYYDHQNIMHTKDTLKIVLYDIRSFTYRNEYFLKGYSPVFWTYDVNDNNKKELPAIQYNADRQVFTFRLVNVERYAVQFEIDTNTLEMRKVAMTKEQVQMR